MYICVYIYCRFRAPSVRETPMPVRPLSEKPKAVHGAEQFASRWRPSSIPQTFGTGLQKSDPSRCQVVMTLQEYRLLFGRIFTMPFFDKSLELLRVRTPQTVERTVASKCLKSEVIF